MYEKHQHEDVSRVSLLMKYVCPYTKQQNIMSTLEISFSPDCMLYFLVNLMEPFPRNVFQNER